MFVVLRDNDATAPLISQPHAEIVLTWVWAAGRQEPSKRWGAAVVSWGCLASTLLLLPLGCWCAISRPTSLAQNSAAVIVMWGPVAERDCPMRGIRPRLRRLPVPVHLFCLFVKTET